MPGPRQTEILAMLDKCGPMSVEQIVDRQSLGWKSRRQAVQARLDQLVERGFISIDEHDVVQPETPGPW